MKWGILALLFCALVLSQSCAAPTYRLYPGAPLLQEQIAVLKKAPNKVLSSIYIDAVNGRVSTDKRDGWYGSQWDGDFRIELLPGTHTLTVRLLGGDWYGQGSTNVTFTAEAGKTYIIKYAIDQVDRRESQVTPWTKNIRITSKWRAWVEEDRGKD